MSLFNQVLRVAIKCLDETKNANVCIHDMPVETAHYLYELQIKPLLSQPLLTKTIQNSSINNELRCLIEFIKAEIIFIENK
jgi:hypothetical protein